MCCFCGCNDTSVNAGYIKDTTAISTTNDKKQSPSASVIEEKNQIIDMFIKYGTYKENGSYQFYHSEMTLEGHHQYSFTYIPQQNAFYTSRSYSVYNSPLFTVDDGMMIFMWEQKESAYFWGQHYIRHADTGDMLSTIGFDFSIDKINPNMTFGNYTYRIRENSFASVSESQMDKYAAQCAKYLEDGMAYAQSIISAYTDGITLWP